MLFRSVSILSHVVEVARASGDATGGMKQKSPCLLERFMCAEMNNCPSVRLDLGSCLQIHPTISLGPTSSPHACMIQKIKV